MNVPDFVDTPDGPSVEGASPELLRLLLDEVESMTSDLGGDSGSWFQPGLDAGAVRDALALEGLDCPEELVVWFGWHNGYVDPPSPQSPTPLPNFSMSSIETALLWYREMRDAEVPQGLTREDLDWGAGEGWLRLTGSSWGLAIECAGGRTARIHCATEEFNYYDPPYFRAVSLCTYAAWWLHGLRSGAYRIDQETGRWRVEESLLAPSKRATLFW